MAPKTYKGKRPPAESSSHFNTERFKSARFAERFQSLFSNRTVIFERIVVDEDLTETRFLQWLYANGLMLLMHLTGACFEDWVREFYCNIFEVTDSSFTTYIRGKTVRVDADRIASLLNLQRPSPRSYPFQDPDNIVIQAHEVPTILCGAPTEWNNLVMKITGLTTDYRLFNTFVCHNIEPRSHSSDLIYAQAFLLYSLGTSTSVDIPLTIFESMLRVCNEPRKLTLPFGAMICKLMIEAGCHAYPHEVPVTRRQKINSRTKAMSDTHVQRYIRGGQVSNQAGEGEEDSEEDRLRALEHAVYDQSVQIEQLEERVEAGFSELEERVVAGFSDIRNQLTDMFKNLPRR